MLSAMFASGSVLPCGARACTSVLCICFVVELEHWWVDIVVKPA